MVRASQKMYGPTMFPASEVKTRLRGAENSRRTQAEGGRLKTSTKTNEATALKIQIALTALKAKGWPSNYVICKDAKDLGRVAREISRTKEFAFDCETSGTNPWKHELYCVSIYTGGTSYLINFRHLLLPSLSLETFKENLGSYFSDPTVRRIGFALNFDCHFIENCAGIECGEFYFDGLTASKLLQPDLKRGERKLKVLAKEFLGIEKLTYEELYGTQAWIVGEPQLSAHYACGDAELHYLIYEKFNQELEKIPALKQLMFELETPVQNLDYKEEREGFLMDVPYIENELGPQLQSRIDSLLNDFSELGMPAQVSPDSPAQLAGFLFDTLRLPRINGNSTEVGVLDELEDKHPIIPKIKEYRSVTKLKSAFVDNLSAMITDSRTHPVINTIGTGTGRSSAERPNMTNQPVKVGPMIRRAFIADEDYVVVAKDIKGQELRILAHFAGPGRLRDVAINGDIYAEAAAVFYGGNPSDYSKTSSNQAIRLKYGKGKQSILAIFYGAQENKLALIFECSKDKARKFLNDLFRRFPELKNYQEQAKAFAKKYGYVQSILGRRRYIDFASALTPMQRWSLERLGMNGPIQMSGADQIKLGFLRCSQYLKMHNYKSGVRFRVHDENVFWMHKDEVNNKQLHKDLDYIITDSIKMDVPFKVTTEIYGRAWGMSETEE